MKIQKGYIQLSTVLFLIMIMGWFTHIYVCFSHEKWGFLIAGAVFFPVAIAHGIGTWFGLW